MSELSQLKVTEWLQFDREESEELTYDQKLVGFASVNRGCKDSIKSN